VGLSFASSRGSRFLSSGRTVFSFSFIKSFFFLLIFFLFSLLFFARPQSDSENFDLFCFFFFCFFGSSFFFSFFGVCCGWFVRVLGVGVIFPPFLQRPFLSRPPTWHEFGLFSASANVFLTGGGKSGCFEGKPLLRQHFFSFFPLSI